MINFILRLKEFRKLRGLTQKELAIAADLTQEYISDLEKQDRKKSPTLDTIEKLSKALNCCPYRLIVPNGCDLIYSKCKKTIKIPAHKDIGNWLKSLEEISKMQNIPVEKLAEKAVQLIKKEYSFD